MADFQNGLISPIFGFFFEMFFARNKFNLIVDSFSACSGRF